MKHIYFFILVLFSINITFTQNGSLLGQWYLDQVVVDNIAHNNYYNEDQNMSITFTSNSGSIQDNLMYEGDSSCNSYNGDYTADSTTITINSMAITALDCNGMPKGIYENLYITVLGGNTSLPNSLNYTITGAVGDQTLTITNPTTGDYAVYGNAPATSILVSTWYLSRIEIPGASDINVPLTDAPSLTFTNNFDPVFFYTTTEGFGDCNGFNSGYELSINSGGDNILIRDFLPTLAVCTSSYEDAYFSVLESVTSNYFEFEIINNGSTLIMTDLLGASLIFGDTSLSTEEFELSALMLKLKENPVTSTLELEISETISNAQYYIVTIQGQIVKKGKLDTYSIAIDHLQSGLYFLSLYTENKASKTLKFIKK